MSSKNERKLFTLDIKRPFGAFTAKGIIRVVETDENGDHVENLIPLGKELE